MSLSSPKVMGILNITPDSFYDGGKYNQIESALAQVSRMLEDGMDILDIGAASSRPGANILSASEEINRSEKILKEIVAHFPDLVISFDTYNSESARWAVDNGISIINDISAGEMDSNMFRTIAELKVPYIIMHMQGSPQNMQINPTYENIILEVTKYLSSKVQELKLLGISDIVIDPGFGFGKSVEHNFELMNQLDHLQLLELPTLVGISRKSMINKVLKTTPSEALNGTTVLNTIAVTKGANILRVHDVKEAKETIQLLFKMSN